MDEKTGIQALDRTAPILPLMPGTPQRRTHDYRRHGTTDLFAALDAATGKVITATAARRRSEEFRKFLNLIDSEVPDGLDIHIVLDNVSTHKTPTIKRWLVRHGLGVPDFGGGGLLESCCCSVLMSSFELDWCQHAKGGVAALPVVPDLEVFEDPPTRRCAVGVALPTHTRVFD